MVFTSLVVHPDVNARMRFKAVASSLACFKNVSLVSSLNEGRYKLEHESDIDLIYLSSRFDKEVVSGFIDYGKTGSSKTAGYVLMFNGNEVKQDEVAAFIMCGIDGVLSEPFSAETLLHSTEKVGAVVQTRKRKLALEMYTHKVVEAFDKLSENRRKNIDAPLAMKSLSEIKSVISHLDEDEFSFYMEKLTDACCSAKPFIQAAALSSKPEYTGSSQRVRRMVLRKN